MHHFLYTAAAVVLCTMPAHALITSTKTVEVSKTPSYQSRLEIINVVADSIINIMVPYNYHVLKDPTVTPASVTCHWSHRNIFNDEISSARCTNGADNVDLMTIAFNGTAVFLPVRFPVTICANSYTNRCWTNEHIWSTPSPLEQLISCQVVAIVVLVFWSVVGCTLCVCLRRVIWYNPPPNKKKCQHFAIGEEVELLEAAERVDVAAYSDKGDGVESPTK